MSHTKSYAKSLERALARKSLREFTLHTMPEYRMNWHHEVIMRRLDRVLRHEVPRQILQAPPRTGKSELCAVRLPAYELGRNPDSQIIFGTHSSDLAEKATRNIKRVMRSPAYQELFDTRIGAKDAATEFSTNGTGGFKAFSVQQAIAGYGANVLILDDLIANRLKAESLAHRNMVYEWMLDDAFTRLEWPAAVILMFTRWHFDDPIGRLLVQEEEAWDVMRFLAIQDEPETQPSYDPRKPGEPLWPGRLMSAKERMMSAEELEAAGVDHETLVKRELDDYHRRRRRDAYGFESLYQARPAPREGGMFKRAWFQEYTSPPSAVEATCKQTIISVDATFGKSSRSDKVAILVAGRQDSKIFVLDEVNRRMDFPETRNKILELRKKWPRSAILIERKANGQALIDDLRGTVGRVIAFDPGTESKETRAQAAAARAADHQIYIPSKLWAPWILDWIEDFAGFPSRPFDDRVDALSQVCIHWQPRSGALDHLKRVLGRI